MARIALDLAHAYKAEPKEDSDFALLPLKLSFEDGGAYALLAYMAQQVVETVDRDGRSKASRVRVAKRSGKDL